MDKKLMIMDENGWRRRGCLLAGGIALGGLCAWEVLVRTGALSPLFYPSPTTIARTLWELTVSGVLPADTWCTLRRLFLAFFLGAVPGLLLGLSMGWSRRLRAIVDPFIAAVHPVPKTALLPLMMIFLGIGESSKIAVAALAAFFPVLINSMAGVRHISPIHFEVAANYHARPWKVFTRVVLPGSLPLVLAGARLAFNSALVVTIAIELIAASDGLGNRIWFAWETMRTEQLFATLAVTAAIGITFNYLLKRATERLVPWQTERMI